MYIFEIKFRTFENLDHFNDVLINRLLKSSKKSTKFV